MSRIIHNEDGTFLEITLSSGSTVTTPLERLTAADQGVVVSPTLVPLDAPEPAVDEPRKNEWPALLADARARRTRKRRRR